MQDINLQNEVAHSLAKYRNHLEFTGYKVEEEEDFLFGRHPRKVNLLLKRIGERGVLVNTLFSVKDDAIRTDLLEFMNSLNAEFVFMKAYLNGEGAICIETFFEGEYDRTNFAILLENIEFDINIFFENVLTENYIQ